MFTNSIEEEQQFLRCLVRSLSVSMQDSENRVVAVCPRCHKGSVLVQCTVVRERNELKQWHYGFYCNACGERFHPARIRSDIFFHTPYELTKAAPTPFGSVCVRINGRAVPFRYRKKLFRSDECSIHEPIELHLVDIDLRKLKTGDQVFCGFDSGTLEHDSSDERSEIRSCENDEVLFGLCAYDPENWDGETDRYCYQLYDGNRSGFVYQILSDPQNYDSVAFYPSVIVSLAFACIRKDAYADPDFALFLSLTSEIG